MSRITKPINKDIIIVHGSDHAIGGFVDVIDARYARSKDDQQGEGFVFEWSLMFGISLNLINATEDDIRQGDKRIIELCDNFCLKNNYL